MIMRHYQRAAVTTACEKTAAHGNTLLMLPVATGKKDAANCHLNFRWHRDAIRTAVLSDQARRAA